jgi:hypothetical protein
MRRPKAKSRPPPVGRAPLESVPPAGGQSAVSRRLGAAGEADKQSFMFEVVRHRGHWRTLHGGKRSSPFSDQTAAILAAKKLARRKRAEGHSVEVILRRTDGDSIAQSVDTDDCSSSP